MEVSVALTLVEKTDERHDHIAASQLAALLALASSAAGHPAKENK